MKAVLMAIAVLVATIAPATANPLDGLMPVYKTPCQIRETKQQGMCVLAVDAEGANWLVFFDRPQHILWVRRAKEGGAPGEYEYRYQAALGIPA